MLEIPWGNVVGFASDNCNVMVGARNSVLSRVRERQPAVFDIGCICHLANLCVAAGVKALSVSVDDFFVDVYFHFDHRLLHSFSFAIRFAVLFAVYLLCMDWPILQLFLL